MRLYEVFQNIQEEEERIPKSLLKGRTEEQLKFDWGVKGWAFRASDANKKLIPYYQTLYDAIGFVDEDRLNTLNAIKASAKEDKEDLLEKRTDAQEKFDWGVRGWSFSNATSNAALIPRAQALYDAIGFKDEKRLRVLNAIKAKAKTKDWSNS